MGLFFNLKHTKTKCINGCNIFNDKKLYSYWENKNITSDEKHVLNYLQKKLSTKNKNILHIGIGNSYLAKSLKKYKKIDGISLSGSEIHYGLNQNIKNYNIYHLNKFSKKSLFNNKLNSYDLIIDVNLKSYACCNVAFKHLFKQYLKMLNPKGIIITGKKGMKWSRIVKPVLSFSFKNFFYQRLKEFDGPKSNILSKNELLSLNTRNVYKLSNLKKLILIKKK